MTGFDEILFKAFDENRLAWYKFELNKDIYDSQRDKAIAIINQIFHDNNALDYSVAVQSKNKETEHIIYVETRNPVLSEIAQHFKLSRCEPPSHDGIRLFAGIRI